MEIVIGKNGLEAVMDWVGGGCYGHPDDFLVKGSQDAGANMFAEDALVQYVIGGIGAR
jgi:hypothetical protein